MALGDYILCCKCEVKLIYDGDRGQREWWTDRFGEEPKITCPDCQKETKFVGLTNEEIEKLAVENGHATFLNDDEETGIIWFDGDATPFARAIEQKLREKNGGAA